MTEVLTVMIIGAGQLGSGIAQVAVHCGYEVLLYDIAETKRQMAIDSIGSNLMRQWDKDPATRADLEKNLARLHPVASLNESISADFVIEAATENITIKSQIFSSLSDHTTSKTILASSTSSLSISAIGRQTDCPERVIGMHFLHPVPVMSLVEIVRGLKTSNEVTEKTAAFSEALGKTPIEVNDSPGFISNRLLMPMINEAICCVFDGVASVDAVDTIMQLGMRHPMGPLQLADLIGLDTCLSILEILHREYDEAKYRPSPLLRNMVKSGKLGCKSGEGFYLYDN